MPLFRNWWRMICLLLRQSPATAAAAVLITLLRSLVPPVELWLFKGLIDGIVARSGWAGWLAGLTALMAAEELLRRAVPLLEARINHYGQRALMAQMLARAAATPLLAFESPAYYDRLTRVRKGIQEEMPRLVSTTLWLTRQFLATVLTLIALVALQPAAAAVLALLGGPAWGVQAHMAAAFTAFYRSQVPLIRRSYYLAALLQMRQFAQEVRLFGLAPWLAERWQQEAGGVSRGVRQMGLRQNRATVLTGIIGDGAYLGAMAIMGFGALAGRVSAGGFAAAFRGAQQLQWSLQGLVQQAAMLQQSAQFMTDVWSFLDEEPAPVEDSSAAPPSKPGVALEQVTFGYPGRTEPVLTEISAVIPHGQLVALVGENGAGKSTLVKLLLGLYPPDSGQVRIGGNPVGEATRSVMAPVFQDYLRYSFTAGENIGVGDIAHWQDRTRVAAAAASAGADAVIGTLKEGYDTQLGREFEGGVGLSGGQWQKLAIARAYMRQAEILVLDEPTAALDPLAELEVFRQFRELARGRTAFFISHRLGAARLADRILVLRGGRLVEDGTHDQLMALNGEYATLFRTRAHWYQAS